MLTVRDIIEKLHESRSLAEGYNLKGYHYWRYKGECWKCKLEHLKEKDKYKEPVDPKLYHHQLRFSHLEGTPKFQPSPIEIPMDYDSIQEIPDECASDFNLFKSHIDRIQKNLDLYGEEGEHSETHRENTLRSFKYVSSLMCQHKCDYKTLRTEYKNKNPKYHEIFQYVDNTLDHERINNISKKVLKNKS